DAGVPAAAVLGVDGTVNIFGQGLTGAAQLYSAVMGNYGTFVQNLTAGKNHRDIRQQCYDQRPTPRYFVRRQRIGISLQCYFNGCEQTVGRFSYRPNQEKAAGPLSPKMAPRVSAKSSH